MTRTDGAGTAGSREGQDDWQRTGERGDLVADDLVMKGKKRIVLVAGARVNLTNAEFNMLELLLGRAGCVVTKAELTEAGVSRSLEKYDRSVDMHISNLRKKIGLCAEGRRRIDTVRGIGYIYRCNIYFCNIGTESAVAAD